MSDTTNVVWRHTSTTSNIAGDYTVLSSPALDGQPGAIIQVTPRGTGDNHHIGVWYDVNPITRAGHWAIYNQDRTAMPANAQFNVYVGSRNDSFVLTCTTTNMVRNWCYLPQSTGGSSFGQNMHLIVTPVWNPAGKPGVYNDHAIGVWFDVSKGQWAVYNEDLATMPAGASFNVSYAPGELTPG